MVINEEEKNAFTQSVMGDTEGGGGSEAGAAVYVAYDSENATIDASFNELLNYFNEDKVIFTTIMFDDEGVTNYGWYIMTQLKRESYDQSVTHHAYFTSFPFFDGGVHPSPMVFYSTDADEDMVIED